MDLNKKASLLEKYWKGISSIEEEKELMGNIDSIDELSEEDATYFRQIRQFSNLSLDEQFSASIMEKIAKKETAIVRPIMPTIYWKIAAAVMLLISLTFLFTQDKLIKESPLLAEEISEEDPEKAYELTKQALLLVSSKLNKAAQVGAALDKFKETQEKIKLQ